MWREWRRALVAGRAGRAGGRPLSSGSGPGCWRCGRPFPTPTASTAEPRFCPACRALQPPDSGADLFRLMGCERTFRLDQAELRRRFRSLQRLLHPDLFGQRDQAERAFSEQHSALVNRAYRTLRRPLSRGLYLLELRGVALEKGTDSQAEPEFLAEIMEMNEKLAGARRAGGPPTAQEQEEEEEEVAKYLAAKQEELAKDVSRAFDQEDLQKAKQILSKMKYVANLEEKLKKKKTPS